jgi:hypothetical protein
MDEDTWLVIQNEPTIIVHVVLASMLTRIHHGKLYQFVLSLDNNYFTIVRETIHLLVLEIPSQ